MLSTLSDAALEVLTTPSAAEKAGLTRQYSDAWQAGTLFEVGSKSVPDRPARPAKPELRHPRDVPHRKLGSPEGRAAFIHAIAHIELNAIDLAWDIIARFAGENLPKAFFDDWCQVARDEADHFTMLCKRLDAFGNEYGDLPAHDGLWEAAEETSDDLLARLAIVPMVLEARGLDTTPDAVHRLKNAGDPETAAILDRIGREEIPHVAAGVRWFEFICKRQEKEPVETFHHLVRTRFKGLIKAPFNTFARDEAGFSRTYYQPLVA